MRKVLLITCLYPPALQVGCERVVKFEQYLPDFGFRACVLTMQTYGHLPCDRARGVYRAFEPSQLLRLMLQRLRRSRMPVGTTRRQRPYARSEGMLAGTPFHGLYRQMLDRFAIPDYAIGWLPAALVLGLKAIEAEQVDVLLSSSPFETAHLVAACLSRIAHRPWVADFRDGWLFEPQKAMLRKDCWRRRFEQRLERWTVTDASCVTSVSDPLTAYFRRTYAALPDKFTTITNGYDPVDWRDVAPAPRSTRFRLVYTGAFSLSRPTADPRPLFRALQMLPPETCGQLEMLLVGSLSSQERDDLAGMGLNDVVQVVGPVSRPESLGHQLSADVLLLYVGKDKTVATSKLYEYLRARRPILALSAPDAAAAMIVRQSRAGHIVEPDDPQAIAATLIQLFERWRQGELMCRSVGIERYERRGLAGQMAEVLRQAISSAEPHKF